MAEMRDAPPEHNNWMILRRLHFNNRPIVPIRPSPGKIKLDRPMHSKNNPSNGAKTPCPTLLAALRMSQNVAIPSPIPPPEISNAPPNKEIFHII